MIHNTPDLSIIVPCFNEPDNMKILVQQFQKLLAHSCYTIEIIIIDGGSTDQTPKRLKELFKTLDPSHFKLHLMTSRNGYGHDIMTALSHAKGNVLAWTHADLQTDPNDVIKAYELYRNRTSEKTILKGRRKNRQLTEALFTFGMQLVSWALLGTYLKDINAQPKLFSRAFYESILKKDAPSDFSLDLFLLYQAKKNNYAIHEIPVLFKKRQFGEAKGGSGSSLKTKLNLIKRTLAYIIKLSKHNKSHIIT